MHLLNVMTLTQHTHDAVLSTYAVDSETRLSFTSPRVLYHNSVFWQSSLKHLARSSSRKGMKFNPVSYDVTPVRVHSLKHFTDSLLSVVSFSGGVAVPEIGLRSVCGDVG